MKGGRRRFAGWSLVVLLALGIAFFAIRAFVGGNGSEIPRPGGSAVHVLREVRENLLKGGHVIDLHTRLCPTQSAAVVRVPIPARVSARELGGLGSGLVAYVPSNGQVMAAPTRWECTAGVGIDGTEEIAAGPIGSLVSKGEGEFPEVRRNGPAVRELLVPACAGCIAETICSFFPKAEVVKVYEDLQGCNGEARGEIRRRLSATSALVLDPPGVHGAAEGSGGRLAVIGALSFTPSRGLRQLSCALPPPEFSLCAAVLFTFLNLERRG
jgi:hypothetical protein